MAAIIIDKLQEIEQASKSGKYNYSLGTEADADISNTKSESICQALSREQTVSILMKNDSDYYEEYHTAKVWAGKLRSLKPEQRLYAERAIYDVLFEAQLGNLNKSSVKINEKVYRTKPSHSIFTAKSSQNSIRRTYSTDHTHSACASHNCEHDYRSSEVIIAESFPTEIGIISSECQVKLDNQLAMKPYSNQINRNFTMPTSPLNIGTPSNSHSRRPSLDPEIIDRMDSSSMTVARNTPACILMQLSGYLRYFYNRFLNYNDT